jgi:hypothetical protein
MTLDERINHRLAETNLRELLLDPELRNMSHYALKSKGSYLFRKLESEVDRDKLDEALGGLFEKHMHGNVPYEEFISVMDGQFGVDFESKARDWYEGTSMPGFSISPVEIYKFIDGERERYQLRLRVTNSGDSDGLLKLTFKQLDMNMRQGRRFGMQRMMTATMTMGEDYSRFVTIDPGTTKDLGIVLDFQPSSVSINTFISRNLPSDLEIDLPGEPEERKKVVPFDGEKLSDRPIELVLEGETIVDNEDPGFAFESGQKKSLLKRLIPRPGGAEDTEYVGINYWSDSNRWQPTLDSKFHGAMVRSAHYISGGDGSLKASFTANLESSGHYDVYYFVSKMGNPWRRRGRGGDETNYGKHHFFIYHDDGIEETDLDLNGAENGWNYLGSYYISKGEAKIELTNESEGSVVIADAVKWVKR